MNLSAIVFKNKTIIKLINKILLGAPLKLYRMHLESIRLHDHEVFFRRAFNALSFNGIDGDYVEFGCCSCLTFSLAYKHSRKCGMRTKLWAFDSFCGLPPQATFRDEHPRWKEGAWAMSVDKFRQACSRKGISTSEYFVVPGFYEESLVNPLDGSLPKNICMAYIDCDLYSSATVVLGFLMSRLKHGMIIAFDDYYCWSATQVSGERKACSDYFKNNKDWTLVPFIQYGWGGMSFVVESKSLHGQCLVCY